MSYRTTNSSGLRHVLRRAATAMAAAALVCGPAASVATADAVGTGTNARHAAPINTDSPDDSQQFLRLSIDSVTPQMVEANSPTTVTVVGSVANVGDRDVSDVQVRLQRAQGVDEPEQLRTVLQLDQDSYSTFGEFHQVSAVLRKGATKQFSLSMPLRAAAGLSLEITEPGVYPLLVNVNGTPDYGGPARLDDARFLLPILGLPATEPPTEPAASASESASQPPVLPRVTAPVPATLLYPLATEPKLAAGIAGQAATDSTSTVRLVDDSLAGSLAPGGRLHGMLAALDEAMFPGSDANRPNNLEPDVPVPGRPDDPASDPGTPRAGTPDTSPPADAPNAARVPDPAVHAGLCLAIDPDLLVTVDAMTRGYLVTTDPSDPSAETTDGAGRAAATTWLAKLRTLSAAMCTVAVPYAQAELDAVAAVNSPQLPNAVITAAKDIVNGILGTTAVPGMLWPSAGHLTAEAASVLHDGNPTTLLLAANATSAGGPAMRLPDVDPSLSATSFDVPAATALAATGTDPATPAFVPADLRYRIDADSRIARLQDALGAIVWPAIPGTPTDAQEPGAAGSASQGSAAQGSAAGSPEPVVIAPPQLWSVDHDEAAAVLTTFARLIANGLAVSRPLAEVLELASAPDAPGTKLVDPMPLDDVADTPEESSWPDLTADVAALLPKLDTLHATLIDVPNAALSPDGYVQPLMQDLLRALTTAGRDDDDPSEAEAAAQNRLTALEASLADQFAAITVLAPGSVYTLASSQSPLLLVAKNDLPVAVRVRLDINAPAGVNILNYDDYTLPARGSRQIQVPVEIEFSRQIDLRVGLLAPDGTALGEKIHISLQSNAYGNLIPIITAVFGGLLLLLAGRRAWHRIKGKPDPSDERRPVITPPDRPGTEG